VIKKADIPRILTHSVDDQVQAMGFTGVSKN